MATEKPQNHMKDAETLTARINALSAQLISRFENLIGLAALDETDNTSMALNAYDIEAETNALIRATEDVSTLIRQMQETWLFGKLNTIDAAASHGKADENAAAIADMIGTLLERNDRKLEAA